MDCGISEDAFWNMTLAEIRRAIDSKHRVAREKEKQLACQNYILADLIGRSVGRLYSKSAKLPELYEVYPSLFTKEELEGNKHERLAELSALRFKRFVASHNKKIKGGGEG